MARSVRLAAFVVAPLVAVLAACGSGAETGAPITGVSTSDDGGYTGIVLDEPYTVPDVSLTDTEGEPFVLAEQDRRTLVFFGYTNCPDICQVVMSTLASATARLSPSEQERVQVAFVTSDPARDTPQALRTYLDRFDPDFIGATGPIDRIDMLAKPMGIFIKKGAKLPSGGYEVDHTAAVVGVQDGTGDIVWTGATSPAEMAADLELLLAEDR